MEKNTKMLLAGGVVVGLGFWWWWSQSGAANQSLAAHTPPPGTVQVPQAPLMVQDAVMPASPSSGAVAVSVAQQPIVQQSAQLTALLNWAQTTKNPVLYQQMMNQLSPADLASMYNILTTFWAGLTPGPTPAQTSFWNYLRGLYPFLNTGGVGCNNLQCS